MTYDKSKLKAKADKFCSENNTIVTQEIGFGTQGIVYQTAHNTAIKVYDLQSGYLREKSVYTRLKARKIDSIRGMSIPRIVGWNDDLFVFEMSVVSVPCDEVWHEQKAEEFGEHWEEAQAVIREIEHRAGICLADINSGNIKFASRAA